MDFSAILASSVHDLKNSVSMLLGSLDSILETHACENPGLEQDVSQLRYEAMRVNGHLIQLLALYKMDTDQYALNIDHQSVYDCMAENLMQSSQLLEFREIEVELECDEGLYWFFDRNLLSGVINDVVNNAIKYTNGKLRVAAAEVEGYLRISVEDNGEGYPEEMLVSEADGKRGISFESGSTGLGLYFSSLAAQAHKNKDKKGYISLSNDSKLGGGCFQIFLP